MQLRKYILAAASLALFAGTSFAQSVCPEIEPNSNKTEATTNGTITLTAGDAITGTTTGTTTTVASTLLTSVDLFRVKTAALPLGIYQHRMTLTSTTLAHTGTLRGLNQTGTVGVGGTAGTTDTTLQTSSTTTTPPRFNQWYGFGKQEEIYYRVAGTSATTDAYAATLSTSTVPFTVLPQAFEASAPIVIQTVGQTTADTDLHVYDASLNAIPGFDNDNEGPSLPSTQSRITRTFAPGIYFLAVGRTSTAWNFPAPADDDIVTGTLMDFPDVIMCSSTTPSTTTDDRDFQVVAANGAWNQANQVVGPDPFSIQWFMFSVQNGAPTIVNPAPANDACANATALLAAGGTVTGTLLGATNDGAATCDPGGAASRDVWYSYTNTDPVVHLVTFSTCGTTAVNDTVLSVYASCGGTEVACSDDNAGCTAQPLSSLVSAVLVNPSQSLVIRVSDKGLGGVGDFTLVTSISAPTPPNDDCNTPIAITAGVYPFDTSGATTGTQGQGTTVACNTTTSVKKDLWYTYTANVTGSVTFSTCGLTTSTSTDTKISYYNGAGCPVPASPVGCDDDACVAPNPELNTILTFPVTCGAVYTIQLGNYSSTTTVNVWGSFSVTETGTPCTTPSTAFCTGDVVGVDCLGCGNNGAAGRGCANSGFAVGGLLVNGGISSIGADSMTLTASDIPGPGLFFQANALAASPITFGDGMLCAASGIIRMGVVFPTAGVATYPGGLTPNPITVAGGPINAGDVKHYQCWYRDAVVFCTSATFNLTNGLTLTWAP